MKPESAPTCAFEAFPPDEGSAGGGVTAGFVTAAVDVVPPEGTPVGLVATAVGAGPPVGLAGTGFGAVVSGGAGGAGFAESEALLATCLVESGPVELCGAVA
jgi:hypothetical protein